MTEPVFLTVEDVIAIHALQVERFGGSPGLRDAALVESAVAQAQASFGGQFVHNDLFEMAAAYHFHLVQNHAFVDGNKRIGLAAALVFLDLNGLPIETGTEALYELTMAVAQGERTKAEIATSLRSLTE
ncbi:MAG: type II toxin-antitoxin system death-on-curing family toxin [Myxococcales bacterium]|nr:type II toxin-antitoxin system death-on-curing family toxin [Myxococcales bacterium]